MDSIILVFFIWLIGNLLFHPVECTSAIQNLNNKLSRRHLKIWKDSDDYLASYLGFRFLKCWCVESWKYCSLTLHFEVKNDGDSVCEN
jgi:hypothetical protein